MHDNDYDKISHNKIKEPFCSACLAVPLAFAGAGISAYGSNKVDKKKKRKRILMWSGVFVVFIAILVIVYVYGIKKECETCI
jgi:amino acid transporter